MRPTSELYKQLRIEPGSYYESRVIQGENTYGVDVLKSIKITPALFSGSGPSMGNTWSTQCNVSLLASGVTWPRMAEFSVEVRICSADGERVSEWITLGTYYTDQRSKDESGNLNIIAFDAMMLTEQSWTDKIPEEDVPSSWPITAKKAIDLLELSVGIEIDSRTVLDDTVAFVGLDTTTTARDILADVGAAMGGNWHITPEGKFLLVPFVNMSGGTSAIAGIAIAGIAIVGDSGGEEIDLSDVSYLGMEVTEFSVGMNLSEITGVQLETESGVISSAGTSEGYVIKALCNFSDSNIVNVTLPKVSGFVYKPFKAKGAYLDPAAEVGDLVFINGGFYQICSAEWNISAEIMANIGANYEEEVDHEYTVQSESAKTLKKALQGQAALENRVYSSIEQSATSIMQRVGEQYATQDSVSIVQSSVQLTKDELSVEMQRIEQSADDQFDEIAYYIRYKDGVVIVGAKNDPSSLRISNQEIGMYMGENVMSYWNQNKQRTPTQLEIPYGGSLRLGGAMFQPRTSGNISLLWVGED